MNRPKAKFGVFLNFTINQFSKHRRYIVVYKSVLFSAIHASLANNKNAAVPREFLSLTPRICPSLVNNAAQRFALALG
jgi:hypothetical protein